MADVTARPAILNIDGWQGDDFELTITMKEEGTENPIDISGHTFATVISTDPGSANAGSFVTTIVDGPNGVLRLEIDGETTAKLTRAYNWELQGTDTSSKVKTYLRGKIKFDKDII